MWSFLFSLRGRASRYEIWVRFLLPLAIAISIAILLDYFIFRGGVIPAPINEFERSIGIFTLAVGAFYLWPSIAVSVKRLHDLNLTGWWIALPAGMIALLCVFALWIALVSRSGGFAGFELEEADSKLEFLLLGVLLAIQYVTLCILAIFFVTLLLTPGKREATRFEEHQKCREIVHS